MKQFTNTQNKTYTFSSCIKCEAKCCDGRKGTIFSQILLEDFIECYENYPILFIFGELGYVKPVIILTNGKSFCKYLQDFKCEIYNNRSSICKAYPLSSNIDDNIYIDENCPAVNNYLEKNKIIVSNNIVTNEFKVTTLSNYQEKYINTHFELEKFNKKENFKIALIINGIKFYKYIRHEDNKYIKMHQNSLIHLEDKYFKDLSF